MRKILMIVLCSCLLIGCSSTEDTPVADTGSTETTETESVSADWQDVYDKSDIKYANLKFFAKNSKKYKGDVICSVGKVEEKDGSELQFDTDDSNFFYEVTCKFKKENKPSGIKAGTKVCFIGKVADTSSFFGNESANVNNCFILASGDGVSKYEKKIKKQENKQKSYVAGKAEKQKAAKKKKKETKRNDYMSKCKSYPYKSIKRNPDKYDGKFIKIEGKVIQVDEGWFDSVSMRVEDSNGNDWFVTFSYSDGQDKFLEGDRIAVYGKCDGTEQYETILGDTRRIPSIEAEYILM